jgi:hypothetical protein
LLTGKCLLVNGGNTCYINSVIQLLFSVRSFIDFIREHDNDLIDKISVNNTKAEAAKADADKAEAEAAAATAAAAAEKAAAVAAATANKIELEDLNDAIKAATEARNAATLAAIEAAEAAAAAVATERWAVASTCKDDDIQRAKNLIKAFRIIYDEFINRPEGTVINLNEIKINTNDTKGTKKKSLFTLFRELFGGSIGQQDVEEFLSLIYGKLDCLDTHPFKGLGYLDEIKTANIVYRIQIKDISNNKLYADNVEGLINDPVNQQTLIKIKINDENTNLILLLGRTVNVKLTDPIKPTPEIEIGGYQYILKGAILHYGDDFNSGHYTYLVCNDKGEPDYIISDSVVNKIDIAKLGEDVYEKIYLLNYERVVL